MTVDKLVTMANGVAAFFRAYPEAEAITGVHDHLHAFWTPGMLAQLRSADPVGLDELAAAALRHRTAAHSPTEREAEGPDALGSLASDAG